MSVGALGHLATLWGRAAIELCFFIPTSSFLLSSFQRPSFLHPFRPLRPAARKSPNLNSIPKKLIKN
jgi:hypothetical protein